MSTALSAVAPKRQRGRLRVDAIMQAGAALFAEKGFDAATMTEIAARSGTAIGSLYRFFPTKETLADALILRYGELLFAGLDEIIAGSAGLSSQQLADVLVDLMLRVREERSVAVALVDRQDDASGRRTALKVGTVERIARALRVQNDRLTEAQAEAMGAVLLHLLKSVPAFADGNEAVAERMIAEVRKMAGAYIAAAV
jgi:AcrR family transcriptional regulator